MSDERDQTAALQGKIRDILQHVDRGRVRGKRKSASEEDGAGPVIVAETIGVVGDNAINIGELNISSNQTVRKTVTPGPQHIPESTVAKLKELIDRAVASEAKTEDSRRRCYAKWYSALQRKFRAASCRFILVEDGDRALAWMAQQVGRLRPKLKKVDAAEWRTSTTKAIWARSKNLGMRKDEVHRLAAELVARPISSIKDLTDAEIGRLYMVVFNRQR